MTKRPSIPPPATKFGAAGLQPMMTHAKTARAAPPPPPTQFGAKTAQQRQAPVAAIRRPTAVPGAAWSAPRLAQPLRAPRTAQPTVLQAKFSITWLSTGKPNEYKYNIVDENSRVIETSPNSYIYLGNGIWRGSGTENYYLVARSNGKPNLQLNEAAKRHATSPSSRNNYYPRPYNTNSRTFTMRGRTEPNSADDQFYHVTDSPLKNLTPSVKRTKVSAGKLSTIATPDGKVRTYYSEGRATLFEGIRHRPAPRNARYHVRRLLPRWVDENTNTDNLKVSVLNVTMTTPAGSERPAKNTVMQGTAAGHARQHGYKTGRWEWLHLVGHGIGGHNARYNLVAGAFDRNTEMIPLENLVKDAKTKLKKGEHIKYKVTATLVPDTHIAEKIEMSVTLPDRLKSKYWGTKKKFVVHAARQQVMSHAHYDLLQNEHVML